MLTAAAELLLDLHQVRAADDADRDVLCVIAIAMVYVMGALEV